MRKTLLLLIAAAVVLSACSVRSTPVRTLAAVVPAAGLSTVVLTSSIGVVVFQPSPDASIHVSVGLMSQHTSFLGLFTSSRGEKAALAAVLSHALSQGTLTLGMQYPGGEDTSAISEHWTIELPASLSVHAQVSTGELNVSGISGGVDATLNVGKVALDLPGGPVKVSMDVGKVNAAVHSLDYGDVTLNANVGKTTLTVDGAAVGTQQKSGTSDSLAWKGSGKNAINMRVNVGKLDVALMKN